jgi:hypothetical protein
MLSIGSVKQEATIKTSPSNPLTLAAVSIVGIFFYVLGVAHLVDDLAHHALGWPISAGWDYEIAAVAAITWMLVRTIVPKIISDQQLKSEKDILDRAAAITRAAGAPGAPLR